MYQMNGGLTLDKGEGVDQRNNSLLHSNIVYIPRVPFTFTSKDERQMDDTQENLQEEP